MGQRLRRARARSQGADAARRAAPLADLGPGPRDGRLETGCTSTLASPCSSATRTRPGWQRGSNENTNGLLRQYFPKGSDFSTVTEADLDAVATELNERPLESADRSAGRCLRGNRQRRLAYRTPHRCLGDDVRNQEEGRAMCCVSVRSAFAGMVILGLALTLLGHAAPQAHARWTPPQSLKWYWQLQGNVLPPKRDIQATDFDLDVIDTDNVNTVTKFHDAGQKAICYIDVGTWESWRADAGSFPPALLGKTLPAYKDERYLDVRPGPKYEKLQVLMAARFKRCSDRGFDAVEPDNMDGYQNKTGFPISADDQLKYNRWVAQKAHEYGLAVFQKNDPAQAHALQQNFDGAITEQCNQYGECSKFQSYLTNGKPVLNAEYKANLYPGFCSADNTQKIMGALFSVALDGSIFKPCWA